KKRLKRSYISQTEDPGIFSMSARAQTKNSGRLSHPAGRNGSRVLAKMKKVLILGGGISGLTALYRLQNRADVHLYEASDRLGGVIQTVHEERFLMELGPDCFLSENPSGIQLAKDLGLESELIGTIPKYRQSFIVKNGKLIPVPSDF